ncbi:MAG: sulfurtransferase complex subunit TusD [Aeromonas sp.]
MSLRFAIAVTGPAYGTQQASSAYRFAREVLAQGHQLSHIFFYQAGVANANHLLQPASDETDLHALWCALAQETGLTLEVCVAAALRRGVVDASEAQSHGLAGHNLAAPFRLSGLGQLAEALLTCDRFVQF